MTPTLLLLYHQGNKTSPSLQETGHLILHLETFLSVLICASPIHIHKATYLMVKHLQNWQRVEVLPPTFLQTAQ